jgi:hypothetical protein
LAEFIGLLISEGSVVSNRTILFSNTNPQIIQRFIELLQKNFGDLRYLLREDKEKIFQGHKWKNKTIIKKKVAYTVYIHSSLVRRLLEKFGVGYHYAP